VNLSLLIVVPTLDSYALLPRLVTSIQRQNWSFWRILFIDGPSGPKHRSWLQDCCFADPRCSWIEQDPAQHGIFGAMNQGFAFAQPADWLLFWGSDDWSAAHNVLCKVAATIEESLTQGMPPDLIVCRGRYVDTTSGALGRHTVFQSAATLATVAYRRALLLGSTPPHQATLFGPGARQRLAQYAPGFRLSADLDYFLQLSRYPSLQVQCLDLELVHMADGGVSGQQTQRRLQEVRCAYRRAFGQLWWLPFLMRYARRVASLVKWKR